MAFRVAMVDRPPIPEAASCQRELAQMLGWITLNMATFWLSDSDAECRKLEESGDSVREPERPKTLHSGPAHQQRRSCARQYVHRDNPARPNAPFQRACELPLIGTAVSEAPSGRK
jgi:hypothetical protein